MNIVFITDAWQPLTGGGQKLYWEVLSRLAKKNWQITVVTRALRYQGKLYDKSESYFKNCLQIIRLGPAVSFFNPLARLWFIFQSWWYCVKLDPDRFMATTWLPALTLQLIKVFKKTPLVLLAIGFGSRYKWIEDLLTRGFKYDLVITDDWTFKEGKFIPNGVNLSRAQSRDKWRNFTFLFIGRNEPRKGAELLKQAFLQVQRHYPNVRLRLIGPGFKLVSQ
ncbi:glycosyltransferase family 4 protein, partial [Patescibacteria group bacterium]|nr:glycosyltransferase family 4 protein [Patescibacteria group bacterium]